ncbi:MAG: hypothetical protein J1F42_01010 [Lachnospiraceae bacterium]|nr:hypothetical protein [Lachnospiraceae bacterium]
MEIIGLFFPAIVSVWIKHTRNTHLTWNMPKILFEYGIYVLINVLITGCTITYGLGLSGVTSDAFNSFPFFIKYTIIALVAAIVVPYIEEIIRKYIKVTLTVRSYDEQKNTHMEEH